MKIKIFLLLIALLPIITSAQWKQANGPYGGTLNDLAVDKRNWLYAAGRGGFFYSKDLGTSWAKIDLGNLDVSNLTDIIPHPSGKIFALGTFGLVESDSTVSVWNSKNMFPTWLAYDASGRLYAGQEKDGIHVSVDNGKTWEYVGLKGFNIQSISFIGENFLIASTLGGIFMSADRGENWNFISLPRKDMFYMCITDSHNYIYAYVPAENKINRSKDYGHTWETIITSEAGKIEILTNGNILIRYGTNTTLSSDQGSTWKPDNIFGNGYSAIQELENSYIGIGRNGVYKKDKDGNWVASNYGINLASISSLVVKSNYSFVVTKGELYRSSDLGDNWEKVNVPFKVAELIYANNENIYIRPSYIIGSLDHANIFRSSDYGNTWSLLVSYMWGETVISPDEEFFASVSGGDISFKYRLHVNTSSLPSLPRNVTGITFDNDDNLYYSQSNILYKFSSKTGKELEPTVFDSNILSVKSTKSGDIYVATQNTLYVYQDHTWSSISVPYVGNVPYKLFVQNNNLLIIDHFVYGIGRTQVLLYLDRVKKEFINISPKNYFTSFICAGMNETGDVLLGTSSRSILHASLSLTEREQSQKFKIFYLSQNYPNPFNPSTTIDYQISTPGLVTLKVYDLLGREVAILVNEYKQAGNHNCKLRIENGELSSGIYFYRLQSGSYAETKKLILMK